MRLGYSCAGPPGRHAYKQHTPPPSCIRVENTPALMQPLQASRFIHSQHAGAEAPLIVVPSTYLRLDVHEALSIVYAVRRRTLVVIYPYEPVALLDCRDGLEF
uniref:Uncharacterized protein n=1 Tax=Photinus pyralis TaxID=7054 RepID=A0A1Y1LBR4_PHOPY